MGFFRFFFLGQGPISSTHRLLTLFTALRHLAHFWTGTKLRYDEYGCDKPGSYVGTRHLAEIHWVEQYGGPLRNLFMEVFSY